ncbi:PAAR-like domain-containing protein [Xylophilus sp. GW821-FHT01B05]
MVPFTPVSRRANRSTSGSSRPTPFPNIGMPPMGAGTTAKVLVSGMPALTKTSKIPMTNGDQGGAAGGVVWGQIMVEFVQGSTEVKFEGQFAVRLSDPTKQNKGNAMGAVLAPSQSKVMVMS